MQSSSTSHGYACKPEREGELSIEESGRIRSLFLIRTIGNEPPGLFSWPPVF